MRTFASVEGLSHQLSCPLELNILSTCLCLLAFWLLFFITLFSKFHLLYIVSFCIKAFMLWWSTCVVVGVAAAEEVGVVVAVIVGVVVVVVVVLVVVVVVAVDVTCSLEDNAWIEWFLWRTYMYFVSKSQFHHNIVLCWTNACLREIQWYDRDTSAVIWRYIMYIKERLVHVIGRYDVRQIEILCMSQED